MSTMNSLPHHHQHKQQHQIEGDPIELAPDQDDNDQMVYKPKPAKPLHVEQTAETVVDLSNAANAPTSSNARSEPMSEALRWALDALHQPAIAAADWLARDIDPTCASAADLLSSPTITLQQVRQAKSVFKTMRIVGEKSADRRVGARMYAAAIAAGLVRHGKKITTQSDRALKRGFQSLLDDRRMPLSLRDLAGMALCALQQQTSNSISDAEDETPRSKSA